MTLRMESPKHEAASESDGSSSHRQDTSYPATTHRDVNSRSCQTEVSTVATSSEQSFGDRLQAFCTHFAGNDVLARDRRDGD